MQCVASTIASWRSSLPWALCFAGSAVANARTYEDALAGFTTDFFGDTAETIDALAATGDPRTGPLLEALKDQRLLYSAETKKVFIKDQSDKLIDAATGEAVATPPPDIDNVRLNNRVRGLLDAALGSLTLLAKEPSRRLEAAQAVFKSRDASAVGKYRQGARKGNRPAREEGAHRGAGRNHARPPRIPAPKRRFPRSP